MPSDETPFYVFARFPDAETFIPDLADFNEKDDNHWRTKCRWFDRELYFMIFRLPTGRFVWEWGDWGISMMQRSDSDFKETFASAEGALQALRENHIRESAKGHAIEVVRCAGAFDLDALGMQRSHHSSVEGEIVKRYPALPMNPGDAERLSRLSLLERLDVELPDLKHWDRQPDGTPRIDFKYEGRTAYCFIRPHSPRFPDWPFFGCAFHDDESSERWSADGAPSEAEALSEWRIRYCARARAWRLAAHVRYLAAERDVDPNRIMLCGLIDDRPTPF